MDRGWISLHRKLREHWIWKKPEYVRAWIDLLFRASHKDTKMLFDGEFILVGRGEFITSQESLSLHWHWSRGKVSRFLNLLQKDSMIVLKTGHKATHITICNYGTYQGNRNADEHQTNTKRTSNEHEKDTINKGNKGNKGNKYINERDYKAKPKDLDMIIEFFKEKNIPSPEINANTFYAHYTKTGWYAGKSKIKSWKHCINSWDFQKVDSDESAIYTYQCSSHPDQVFKAETKNYYKQCSICNERLRIT